MTGISVCVELCEKGDQLYLRSTLAGDDGDQAVEVVKLESRHLGDFLLNGLSESVRYQQQRLQILADTIEGLQGDDQLQNQPVGGACDVVGRSGNVRVANTLGQ